MQLEYDLSVGALYIRLSGQPVARTREIDGNTNVDLAEDGSLVGIEVISISRPWPLTILRDYPVPDEEIAQVCAYFGPQQLIAVPAPPEPPELAPAAADLATDRTPVLSIA